MSNYGPILVGICVALLVHIVLGNQHHDHAELTVVDATLTVPLEPLKEVCLWIWLDEEGEEHYSFEVPDPDKVVTKRVCYETMEETDG